MDISDFPQNIHISIHALREEGDEVNALPIRAYVNFYPRPPRGGRLHPLSVFFISCVISIHALREEGDLSSTSITFTYLTISIHALREEGDMYRLVVPRLRKMISIHALREEGDRLIVFVFLAVTLFLSTPSARRATARVLMRTQAV